LHYCCGELQTVSLIGFSQQKSCCGDKVVKHSCCRDVQLSLKKSGDDQRVHPLTVSVDHPVVDPVEPVFGETESDHLVPHAIAPTVNAPPPDAFPPVFLKNCVFII
jgi:hypothetical protein